MINDPGSNCCIRCDVIIKRMFESASSTFCSKLKDKVHPPELLFLYSYC